MDRDCIELEGEEAKQLLNQEGVVTHVSKCSKRVAFVQVEVADTNAKQEGNEEIRETSDKGNERKKRKYKLLLKSPHSKCEMCPKETEKLIKKLRIDDCISFTCQWKEIEHQHTKQRNESQEGEVRDPEQKESCEEVFVLKTVEIKSIKIQDNTGSGRQVEDESKACACDFVLETPELQTVGYDGMEEAVSEHQVQHNRKIVDDRVKKEVVAFRTWLLEKFSVESLNKGYGVLDIAGGCGQLSAALSVVGIKSTVIDPRSGDLPRAIRRRLKNGKLSFQRLRQCFCSRSLASSDLLSELVKNCSLLVGLHPDQAAGEIAQAGLAFQKPFVVVPCCVFSRQFPSRVVENTPVTTTELLCLWIRQLAPQSIQFDTLDIQGANKIVFALS